MHTSMKDRTARFAITALSAGAIVLLGACGSDSTGPSHANVAGSYSLTSVDGSNLPFTVPNTQQEEIVQSASITLNSDSSYSATASGTVSGESSNIITDAGHYSVSGNQVTFTSSLIQGGVYTGTASGSSLTVTIAGIFVGSSNTSFSLLFTKTT